MKSVASKKTLTTLKTRHQRLLSLKNKVDPDLYNGWYDRWVNPVLTADHAPLGWRFDLDLKRNPLLLERMGINATLNSGAMAWGKGIVLCVRVEGADRKSFFAIAESKNGVDGFRFWKEPVIMPETDNPDTNVYDMRLVQHEDGWIYGLFCTERKDPDAAPGDLSSAVAQCGIARTKDLVKWERLPDLKSRSAQQRNVVLHPEFIKGQYLLLQGLRTALLKPVAGAVLGGPWPNPWSAPSSGRRKLLIPACIIRSRKRRMGWARPPSRPARAGCTWHTGSVIRRPACAMSFTFSWRI